MYQYKNDCLTASIEYNKDYYSDRAKTYESLFLITNTFGETRADEKLMTKNIIKIIFISIFIKKYRSKYKIILPWMAI